MPATSAKNMAIGPAASDLGMGLPVGQDLLDEEKRRRMLLEQKKSAPSQYGDNVLGGAASQVFGGTGQARFM